MDTNDQLASLIEQVKSFPNSLARNKCISHLVDAQVWAEKLAPSKNTNDGSTAQSLEQPAVCICPPGGKHRDCPVHKTT